MSESNKDHQSPHKGEQRTRRSPRGKSKIAVIALVLVAVYALLQPGLNERYGLNLPALRHDSGSSQSNSPANSGNSSDEKLSQSSADRPLQSDPQDAANSDGEIAPDSNPDLLYGVLQEIAPQRYISPAGLLYSPGSQEGHRLEHLRRHTVDDPGRPGSHGVFDGEMRGALQTIDRAYDRAKKGQRTTTKQDGERTVYTVDVGSRIGFVGGRDGARRNHPMARRVRVVLEGNRFITAYPL